MAAFSFISSCELKWQKTVTSKGIIRRLKVTPVTQLHHYGGRLVRDYFDKYVLKKKYLKLWGPCYEGMGDDLKETDLLTVIARQWARASLKAERDLAKLDQERVLRFRYEDFVTNPAEYLERICDHCGEKMDDGMVRGAGELVDPNRREKWRRFSPDVLNKVLPEIEAEMTRHGYTVPEELAATAECEPHDANPSIVMEPNRG